jgi:methyl-accepting chemotaxis protein
MNFRTKIWLLPISAALVFIVGSAASYVVGSRTSAQLEQLRDVDYPYMESVARIDRGAEEFRLNLQSAATEGDDSKLKDVEEVVASVRKSVAQAEKLTGKADAARRLGSAFDTYQAAALTATRAMLTKQEAGDSVKRMQAGLAAFSERLQVHKKASAEAVSQAQAAALAGVRTNVWVGLGTGLAVLLVLGLASRLILASVWRELGDEPTRLRRFVQRVADGDLSGDGAAADALVAGSLHHAVSAMVSRLGQTVSTIRDATESIAVASREIAAGSMDLNTRTEQTSANLQQTASSVSQLTGSVHQSAEAARTAGGLVTTASQAAQRGGNIVAQVVSSMDEINAASRKINDIISVIDGIAFQTNILALNAAVEAARAGEQGRGFAVVAGEVRSLAQRSAVAAREIKTLIGASAQKVDSGSRLVQDAGTAMREIVDGVRRVTEMIGEISTAAQEQASGISQVDNSVNELDRMTQQNAALVEQSAAASESLQEQAQRLAETVNVFRTADAGGH